MKVKDQERIEFVLKAVRGVWEKHPDWRLGQLIDQAVGDDQDIYYLEDELLAQQVLDLEEEMTSECGPNKMGDDDRGSADPVPVTDDIILVVSCYSERSKLQLKYFCPGKTQLVEIISHLLDQTRHKRKISVFRINSSNRGSCEITPFATTD